ncbi:MAG: sigma-70 family RNA polymerase sigma factor [Tissierellia bacterium]|nr:sigma-70 family RNA polymerase sigma factor [Tissierellia bacterium]
MKKYFIRDEEVLKMKDLVGAEDIVKAYEPLILSSMEKYYAIGDYEEGLQEGRLEILEAILDYDGRIHFGGYLKSRLRFYFLNKNNDTREYPVDSQEVFEKILPDKKNFVDDLLLKEEVKILNQGFEKLTPRQKEVLHLLYFKEYKYREVAEDLGISMASVQTHEKRALKKLRQWMENKE